MPKRTSRRTMSDSAVKKVLQDAKDNGKKVLLTFKDNTTDQRVYVAKILVRSVEVSWSKGGGGSAAIHQFANIKQKLRDHTKQQHKHSINSNFYY